jgi:hypothetical protein
VPTFDWQLIVALAAVIGAATFLIVRGLRLVRGARKPACGSCGSCAAAPADQAAQAAGFVPLESLVRENGQQKIPGGTP